MEEKKFGEYRTRYLAYRCFKCGRLLTSIGVEKAWEKAEKAPKPKADSGISPGAVCPCGSRHITPTNPKLWEELFLPRVWVLWAKRVVFPWLKATFDF